MLQVQGKAHSKLKKGHISNLVEDGRGIKLSKIRSWKIKLLKRIGPPHPLPVQSIYVEKNHNGKNNVFYSSLLIRLYPLLISSSSRILIYGRVEILSGIQCIRYYMVE